MDERARAVQVLGVHGGDAVADAGDDGDVAAVGAVDWPGAWFGWVRHGAGVGCGLACSDFGGVDGGCGADAGAAAAGVEYVRSAVGVTDG